MGSKKRSILTQLPVVTPVVTGVLKEVDNVPSLSVIRNKTFEIFATVINSVKSEDIERMTAKARINVMLKLLPFILDDDVAHPTNMNDSISSLIDKFSAAAVKVRQTSKKRKLE